jgi:hypothetical protein
MSSNCGDKTDIYVETSFALCSYEKHFARQTSLKGRPLQPETKIFVTTENVVILKMLRIQTYSGTESADC